MVRIYPKRVYCPVDCAERFSVAHRHSPDVPGMELGNGCRRSMVQVFDIDRGSSSRGKECLNRSDYPA